MELQKEQQLDNKELLAWLRLIAEPRWSLKEKTMLLQKFGSPMIIYQARDTEIMQLVRKAGTKLLSANKLEKYLQWMQQHRCQLITLFDKHYPEALKHIHRPPIALFAVGDLSLLDNPSIAIVGSRRPSPVGSKVASELASGLANSGITIVSGLALGIDGCAHQAALTQQATIAVMACGLDVVYPARHRQLFADICANGLVLSEHLPGTKPLRSYFPQRNRIVSGLSLGVIIVEAADRSGTMITARLAVEQDRELFVIPGSVYNKQYAGSHQLIQQGAQLITSYEDVLAALALPLKTELLPPEISQNEPADERPLLSFINYESTSVEKIIVHSGLTAAEVSSILLILEVDGKIAKTDEGGYLRLV